jgi:hypothetical protein
MKQQIPNPVEALKPNVFTPMITVTKEGLITYSNGATGLYDALNKFESRINNMPKEERAEQLKQEFIKTIKQRNKRMSYAEALQGYGEKVKKLWEDGKPLNDIQLIMSMSQTTIKRILKDMGVEVKQKRPWDKSFTPKKGKKVKE